MKCLSGATYLLGTMKKSSSLVSATIIQSLIVILISLNEICHSDKIQSETQAMMYLSEYGYLSPRIRNPLSGYLLSEEALTKAIIEFQAFANLNLTGRLDDETLNMMSLPRCGVRDKVGVSTYSRSKRYALQGSRWKVKNLSYKITKYPKGLSKSETDDEVTRAFSVWSNITPLVFTKKTSGQVHIEIRFETGEHGDGDPFDGPGGTLAHAFFPIYGGDAHFDDTEKWTVRSSKGTNLFQVAAHEFGHSLGLAHSDVRSSLMAPFYRGYESDFKLDADDIQAIQSLYGSKNTSIPTPKPPSGDGGGGGDDDDDDDNDEKPTSTTTKPSSTTPEPSNTDGDEELCNDGTIDAIFNSADDVTYVFKGAHYWQLTEEGIVKGYPKLISERWPNLPNNIDTAFTYKNGKTYFFKGSKYWKYDGTKMDGEYPKDINEGFTGIPDNVQAASVWTGNGKIYFFKGSKFWRFDPSQKPPVKSTYPKPISNWEGIPDNLDDVVNYKNGYTYFFKQGQYWRFNDKDFSVESDADPPFPRKAGFWWFGCRSTQSRKYFRMDVHRNASEYRPTIRDVRHEHSVNQNTDVGDLLLDADSESASLRLMRTVLGRNL